MSSAFGHKIKALRFARRLTLEQVAKRIGSHKGYVSGIENDKVNPPSPKIIRRIAKLFNEPYEVLLAQAELQKIHRDVPLETLRAAIDDEIQRRSALAAAAAQPMSPEVKATA